MSIGDGSGLRGGRSVIGSGFVAGVGGAGEIADESLVVGDGEEDYAILLDVSAVFVGIEEHDGGIAVDVKSLGDFQILLQ